MSGLAGQFPHRFLIGGYAILCTAVMIVMFAASHWVWGDVDTIDRTALIVVRRQALHPGSYWLAMKQIMLFLTSIGSFPVLAILTLAVAAILVRARRGQVAARLVIIAGVGMAAANLVKLVIGRARPEVVPHWIDVSTLSFPSGHTADSSIAYLLIAMIAIDATPRVAVRRTIAGLGISLVVLIGISRVYLGVHWPTDVLAGWAFGSTWVLLVAPLLRRPDKPHSQLLASRTRFDDR